MLIFRGISLPCSAFITSRRFKLAHIHISATRHYEGDGARSDRYVFCWEINFASATHPSVH